MRVYNFQVELVAVGGGGGGGGHEYRSRRGALHARQHARRAPDRASTHRLRLGQYVSFTLYSVVMTSHSSLLCTNDLWFLSTLYSVVVTSGSFLLYTL